MIPSVLALEPTGRDTLTGSFCRPLELSDEEGEAQAVTGCKLIVALNERVGEIAFLDMLIFNPSES